MIKNVHRIIVQQDSAKPHHAAAKPGRKSTEKRMPRKWSSHCLEKID